MINDIAFIQQVAGEWINSSAAACIAFGISITLVMIVVHSFSDPDRGD